MWCQQGQGWRHRLSCLAISEAYCAGAVPSSQGRRPLFQKYALLWAPRVGGGPQDSGTFFVYCCLVGLAPEYPSLRLVLGTWELQLSG